MKITLLAALLAFSPTASGQNKPEPPVETPLSDTDQIRAARSKADAREQSESKARPWDRGADGLRPWERKEAVSPR